MDDAYEYIFVMRLQRVLRVDGVLASMEIERAEGEADFSSRGDHLGDLLQLSQTLCILLRLYSVLMSFAIRCSFGECVLSDNFREGVESCER